MLKNEKHSHRDYTGADLRKLKPEEFSGSVIIGTQFGREKPPGHPKGKRVKVLPEGVSGVVFKQCCFDNAEMPPGSSFEDCTSRNFEVQIDAQDWVVNGAGKPLVPVNSQEFERNGWSLDPKDIGTPRGAKAS